MNRAMIAVTGRYVGLGLCGLSVALVALAAGCGESTPDTLSWSAPDQLSVPAGAVLALQFHGPDAASWQLTESANGLSWTDDDGASSVRFDAPGQYFVDVVGTNAESDEIFEHRLTVEVTSPAFRNLSVNLDRDLQPGDTVVLELLADDQVLTDRAQSDPNYVRIVWASSDLGVASVNDGALLAVAPGTTTLMATIAEQSVHRSVTVHGAAWIGVDGVSTLIDRSGASLGTIEGRLLGRAGDAIIVADAAAVAVYDLAGEQRYACVAAWADAATSSVAWSAEQVAFVTTDAIYTVDMQNCETTQIADRGASTVTVHAHWLIATDSEGVRAIDPEEPSELHEFACDAAAAVSLDELWIACNDRSAFIVFDPWVGELNEIGFAVLGVEGPVHGLASSSGGATALVSTMTDRIVEVDFGVGEGAPLALAPGLVELIVSVPGGDGMLALLDDGRVALLQSNGTWRSLDTAGVHTLQSATPQLPVQFVHQANASIVADGDDGPFTDQAAVFGPPHGRGAHAGLAIPGSVFEVRDDATLEVWFDGWVVMDGPGVDVRVYENAFYVAGTNRRWLDPATVEWTEDGVEWLATPSQYPEVPGDDPSQYTGVTGVNPVLADGWDLLTAFATSGGDEFDLAELGLSHVIAMRIRDIPGDVRTTDLDAVAFQYVQARPTVVPSDR